MWNVSSRDLVQEPRPHYLEGIDVGRRFRGLRCEILHPRSLFFGCLRDFACDFRGRHAVQVDKLSVIISQRG